MTFKYAIIGCGRISPNHIAAALDNGMQITAVCDLEETKMTKTIEEFNLSTSTKMYRDYKRC